MAIKFDNDPGLIRKQNIRDKAFLFQNTLTYAKAGLCLAFAHFGEHQKKQFDVIYDLYKMKQFHWLLCVAKNRPRSIYQYSNMAPRLSGQTSIFGVVFFVSKSLLGIERQKKLKNLQF